ncbi:2-amino-4-hydroxy-6-hydroxymethyldihydropteridine diphosphokinase [Synechococcus sp. BDU 130192]|uniref:2-amino-4-hydroxy-6- hydroxymethyldihydropteridine diphosphokinase n=1 Tax=Synechococcus sp. BDU 130192 TaxID=2042059 RepID=UPI0020B12A37|nr:2-amino-4-hydroxy-6-hydroxymethyldihydropteridine diphosphokinase [Synechococcus sp. BDU 130192]
MERVVDVAIALGSNLGNSLEILENAIQHLSEHPAIALTARSAWYRTAPVGPPQPDYINGCVTGQVRNLSPEALLEILLAIEQVFGRERRERWGARTLDLDLLLYGQDMIYLPHLQVPHPRMQERAFVLVPLAEIAPHWCEPRTQRTIQALKERLSLTGIQRLDSETTGNRC